MVRPIIAWTLAARPKTAAERAEFIDLSTNTTYVYKGGRWVDKNAPAVTVERTVTTGDILHDAETGKDFVRKGNKWVEQDEAPAAAPDPKKRTTRKKVEK